MFAALLILAGVVFLVLAGLNVNGPRFSPQWFGFALLALGFTWPVLTLLTR